MSYKGNLINDRYVLFGGQLDEKTKEAISRGCPTGNDIIRSLPASAFVPVEEKIVETVVEEKKVDKKKERIARKKAAAKLAAANRHSENLDKQNSKPTIEKVIEEHKHMSLDDELEGILDEVKPKQQVVEKAPEVEEVQASDNMRTQILSLLSADENAPTLEQIDAWKEQYGKNGLHVMSFGDNDNYIYHHLTRGEWKKIKEIMKQLKDSENSDELEEKLKEKVVCNCVVWPQADQKWLDTSKAGVVDSLYQMILLNSGFLTPQQAMLLTTQL